MGDDVWWAAGAPVLERLLDPAAFPVASRVGSGRRPVARMLDGGAVLVENCAAAPTFLPTGEKRPRGRTS